MLQANMLCCVGAVFAVEARAGICSLYLAFARHDLRSHWDPSQCVEEFDSSVHLKSGSVTMFRKLRGHDELLQHRDGHPLPLLQTSG